MTEKAMPTTDAPPAIVAQDPPAAPRPIAQAPINQQKAVDTAPPPVSQKAVTPAPGAAASVAMIWELPYASRREIPELKLTMHVYSAQPAQRFVIVNGNRQIEGDDIEDLRVVEIRPDGVIFDHKGVRFLYPRGGR
jgi:general secretion pathway protein B